MKRIVLVFVCALIVVTVSQSTHAQTANDFLAELEMYSTTRTQEELTDYARSRIAQMTGEAERSAFTVNGVLLSDGLTTPFTINGVLLSDNFPGSLTINGVLLSDSLRDRCSSCRNTYNEDLLLSAALASEILLACDEMSEFLTGAADALAMHAAGIAAAKQERIACYESVFAALGQG